MVKKIVRNTALSSDEILKFSRNGFLLPGKIFSDETIERMQNSLTAAQDSEQKAGREYDLLDPGARPASYCSQV